MGSCGVFAEVGVLFLYAEALAFPLSRRSLRFLCVLAGKKGINKTNIPFMHDENMSHVVLKQLLPSNSSALCPPSAVG